MFISRLKVTLILWANLLNFIQFACNNYCGLNLKHKLSIIRNIPHRDSKMNEKVKVNRLFCSILKSTPSFNSLKRNNSYCL